MGCSLGKESKNKGGSVFSSALILAGGKVSPAVLAMALGEDVVGGANMRAATTGRFSKINNNTIYYSLQ